MANESKKVDEPEAKDDTNQEEQHDLRSRSGPDHPNFKHGRSYDPEYRRAQIRKWQARNKAKVKDYAHKTAEKRKNLVAELRDRIKELEQEVRTYKEVIKTFKGE